MYGLKLVHFVVLYVDPTKGWMQVALKPCCSKRLRLRTHLGHLAIAAFGALL